MKKNTTHLASALKQVRKKLGFASAKRFHKYLSTRTTLDFNYSYYARIEASQVIPSAKVIDTLSNALGEEYGDLLTYAYCQTLFPKKKHLFESTEILSTDFKKEDSNTYPVVHKTITLRQINKLSATRLHYFLLLIFLNARKPISLISLKKLFKAKQIKTALNDLLEVKLIGGNTDGYYSTNVDMKFPKVTRHTKKIYEQFDAWDTQFHSSFDFAELNKKWILRRISPRFLDMIVNHTDLIIDLINSAEETNSAYNNDVIYFTLNLSRGKLPG